jgi:hypothetical protein
MPVRGISAGRHPGGHAHEPPVSLAGARDLTGGPEGVNSSPEEQGQASGPAHRIRFEKLEEGIMVEGPGRHHRGLIEFWAPRRERHQLHLGRPRKSPLPS